MAMPEIQLQAIQMTNARELTREEWLESRRKGIGGSDVAAILGVNPYKSAFGVYMDKIEGTTFEGNIHTEFGNWMEPNIRAEFPKRFKKYEGINIQVYEYPYVLQHPTVEYFIANLDGLMDHPEFGTGIIEIKTASEMQWKQWQDNEIPDMYYCQVQHYLNVTGLSYAYIVALVGKRLLWKLVIRDDEFIELMATRLKTFWEEHIIPKIAPAPAGLDDDTDLLKRLYGTEQPGTYVELHEYQDDYDRYKSLSAELKKLELEQESIKQKFMQALGESELGYVGNKKITWKTTHRKGYTVEPKSFRSLRIY